MNARLDELIQRSLEDRLTPEDAAALQQALEEDAAARARYLDFMNLDVALSALADATAVGKSTAREIPFPPLARFRWWPWAAAACLVLALGGGLRPPRAPSPVRPDVVAAIESTEQSIARMPAPVPPETAVPSWMSPTASLLDPDLARLSSPQTPTPL